MHGAGAPFDNLSADSFIAAMDRALQMEPSDLAGIADALQLRHNWPAVAERVVAALRS